MNHSVLKVWVSGFILLSCIAGVYAADDDGFNAAGSLGGKYFDVFYEQSVRVADLARTLNVRPSDKLLAGKKAKTASVCEGELSDMIDTLYLRVAEILDMNLFRYEGKIKVYKDSARLREVYSNIFGSDLGSRSSFYAYDYNTIYIFAANFTQSVLGHEIASALISHYFAVLPSVKVQEVMAGYVETQLNITDEPLKNLSQYNSKIPAAEQRR